MDERTEKGRGLDVWAGWWEQGGSGTTGTSLFSALGIQAPTPTRAVGEELTPTFPLSSQQPCQVGVEVEGWLGVPASSPERGPRGRPSCVGPGG